MSRRLTQEFEFETGIEAGHEGAPLVVGNTMYMVGPFPNKLFALNLANKGALKWVFNPRANPFAEGKACCDIVNRGAAYATHPAHPDGLIIYAVLDTTVVAVNARTGPRSVAPEGRQGRDRRNDDHRAAGRRRQGDRRQQRRRVRRARLHHRPQRRQRHGRVEGVQHRPRRRGADPGRVPALLSQGPGHQPRRHHLARQSVADRRRHVVDGADLRPAAQPAVPRHLQSGAVEP